MRGKSIVSRNLNIRERKESSKICRSLERSPRSWETLSFMINKLLQTVRASSLEQRINKAQKDITNSLEMNMRRKRYKEKTNVKSSIIGSKVGRGLLRRWGGKIQIKRIITSTSPSAKSVQFNPKIMSTTWATLWVSTMLSSLPDFYLFHRILEFRN